MKKLWDGVTGIIRKNGHILVLVKPNDILDLPSGRVENLETVESALQMEIGEETGLKFKIHNPVVEWSFYKTPDQLIKGIAFE
jgi:8-oxo-dGTP pyrophosphatase MutT (NUDIX family)